MAHGGPAGSWPWLLAGVIAAAAGAAWLARADLAAQREAFETDARIAHRLLSQRAVEHDTILATLALLQPGAGAESAPEQRLPALYPQVLRVWRRDREQPWPDAALAAAEAVSRTQQRAALAAVDFDAGRYTLVRAAEPASFALQIDIARMVPWNEWPLKPDGPVRVALVHGGRSRLLQPGADEAARWHFDFAKHLAADSQPFDLVAQRPLGPGALPWGAMAAWVIAMAAAIAALAAWQRQRAERRRAEELLRLGQVGRLNALGELAAGMAHELNQPLAALLANTQAARRLLDDEPPDLATARAAMRRAAQQARRAADVVGRLRGAVQRPASGHARTLPLAEPVRTVLGLLEPECTRRGVAPRWDAAAASPSVHADPVTLEQIVHNLLMNALQALEQVPAAQRDLQLGIATTADGQAELLVADSGPGIAPDALPRVFEPFFTTRSDGLGLGLSLCETLAAGLGGRLSCTNRVPRGAEFRLTLPLAVAAAPAA